MARRKRRRFSDAQKIAVVEALQTSTPSEVIERFKLSWSMLKRWRREYKAGKLGADQDASEAVHVKGAPKLSNLLRAPKKTPERMFDERVRKAIVLLRQAEEEIERMKHAGTLKEADTAHLYAGLALRLLQGDNGK